MLILRGNSIVLIPLGVCDIFLWTFLSKQGSSLNAQTYPFRISRKEKKKNTWGDNGVMKNGRSRRLSEEIKKDSKLKLTWTKVGLDLRNSWEDLWRFFESVTDDLMFGVNLNTWTLWRFWTMMKKRENNTLMSLYIRDWKRGGFYSAQTLKGNTVRWIKIPLLDARNIMLSKILNNVLRIPKRQKQWWND